MRPQRNAGEYEASMTMKDAVEQASMRPQRNAGEYRLAAWLLLGYSGGFNEAPAKCRGIHARAALDVVSFAVLQ